MPTQPDPANRESHVAASFDETTGQWEFDPHDPRVTADNLYPTYEQVRRHCPIAHGARYGGYWFLSSYELARAAATDTATFSSGGGVYLPAVSDTRIPLLEQDGDEHLAVRRVLAPLFTVADARRLEPRIREIVDEAIDTFVERGEAELISELVEPLPLTLITEKFGLGPGQTEHVRDDALEYLEHADGGPESKQIIERMIDYWQELVRERVARLDEAGGGQTGGGEPGGDDRDRDDLLTFLVRARSEDFRPTDRELAWTMFALTFGGHDSTILALGSALAHLAEHPELRDQLQADRTLLPNAVDELLRLHSSLHNFRRDVTRDVELGGVELRAGDRALLGWGAANRDPAKFPDPDTAILDRANAREHLAFGAGKHICIGQHIARAEIRIAIERVLDRLPDFAANEPVQRTGLTGGGHHHGVTRLAVTFTPQHREHEYREMGEW